MQFLPFLVQEYDDNSDKPTFDLIIGVESMREFGIILNFKEQVITNDTLPMRDITNLPLPRKRGLDFRLQELSPFFGAK